MEGSIDKPQLDRIEALLRENIRGGPPRRAAPPPDDDHAEIMNRIIGALERLTRAAEADPETTIKVIPPATDEAEIRQLKDKANERFESIERRLRKLEANLDPQDHLSLAYELGALKRTVKSLEASIETHRTQIRGINGAINKLEDEAEARKEGKA